MKVLEGEIRKIEINRVKKKMGIKIVGGEEKDIRWVVVKEVFKEGMVYKDGRIKNGDKIIEINGIDMKND